MPQSLEQWWQRRCWVSGVEMPYPIGRFRDAWAAYPALVEQFRPERNRGLLLSQIPPGADVYLLWVCAIGHDFVATPAEQRGRPGRSRSNRSWCPVCATPSLLPRARRWPVAPAPAAPTTPARLHNSGVDELLAPCILPVRRVAPVQERAIPELWRSPVPARDRAAEGSRLRAAEVPPGTAFCSAAASTATSASEGRLRALLADRLAVDLRPTAVRVRTPFFERLEVWPDLVIAEFALAVELDTVGRNADEHVGRRELVDRRKDRLLRAVGWEVIRLRMRPLSPLGPHDLVIRSVSGAAVDALVDRMGEVRGELLVAAYRR